ncbi:hypothetical protein B0T16DRAFT_431542 [Cercophora newfieldiana]|uniref:Uncharacterized protein n=1 Tax=Cercophora newfieldiana TaxID=92897 RepID=A0AA39XZ18_9PEZI|nr:hypothetical protein B0T16DRAFT_431542 [Cercophora newfieldiana]
MGNAASVFVESSLPVAHNGVKSIIFRCAELLMGLFVFKFASLAAARSSHFTSYLMFSEDHIQRLLFLTSRGFSGATVLVFVFTVLSMFSSLYGSLLWALDSPGYIFRSSDSTLAEQKNAMNLDAPYIVQLRVDPKTLDDNTLRRSIGADLFKQGVNVSLSGDINSLKPETANSTRNNVGARIWLDDEGFSVSTDTYSPLPTALEIDGNTFPEQCIKFDGGMGLWNCTFNSTFSQGIVEDLIGRPEVHWDDASSRNFDSQYIVPNRIDNIWATYGRGAGSAAMMQVFTVTKGHRRHTFAETVFRITMLTNPGIPFASTEVEDLVRRAAGPNATDRAHPLLSQIVDDILSAQAKKLSYNFGVNAAESPRTVIQSSWSYFKTLNINSGNEIFSLLHMTATNITLIHSEDVPNPPSALHDCDQPFQNEAYGGKVTQTNCAGATLSREGTRFYGTVDTSAVMVLYGLGVGRSNISSESMSENVVSWVWENTPKMMDLLIARGLAVSGADPRLVRVTVQHLVPAISGLQVLLAVLVAVLAGVAWSALVFGQDVAWSKSFWGNLVHTTLWRGTKEAKGVYMRRTPEVDMVVNAAEGGWLMVDGRPVFVVLPDKFFCPSPY